MGNRPAILALVEKAWGSAGTESSAEGEVGAGGKSGGQYNPSPRSGGGGRGPGYGSRKGVRKPAPKGPPPRRP